MTHPVPNTLLTIAQVRDNLPKTGGQPIVSPRTLEKLIKEDRATRKYGIQPDFTKGRVRYWSKSALERFTLAILTPMSTSRREDTIIIMADHSKQKQVDSALKALLG